MNLTEIKAAVESGKRVCWKTSAYEVIKDIFRDGTCQWLVVYSRGTRHANCIGLTWRDGVTMNGEPEDFFVLDVPTAT